MIERLSDWVVIVAAGGRGFERISLSYYHYLTTWHFILNMSSTKLTGKGRGKAASKAGMVSKGLGGGDVTSVGVGGEGGSSRTAQTVVKTSNVTMDDPEDDEEDIDKKLVSDAMIGCQV